MVIMEIFCFGAWLKSKLTEKIWLDEPYMIKKELIRFSREELKLVARENAI
ncbi:MAG: hypothetical protein PHU66_03820 [Bacteroidaceae bacterium]|nr:hypothetical protein [Bacteroidaceae bacterium]